MKWSSAIPLLLILSGSVTADVRTLEQDVAYTISTNPLINREFNQLQSRGQEIKEAYSGYLPSLTLSAGIGHQRLENDNTAITGNDRFDPWNANITLRQYLFQGFEVQENVTRTRAEAEAQRFKLWSDAEDLALRVIEVYLGVILTEQIQQLTTVNRNKHQKQYDDIQRRQQQGLSNRADLSQMTARLAESNANLIAAENNYQDAKEEYFRVVGRWPTTLDRPEVDQNFLPSDLEQALQGAHKNNPTLQLAHQDIDAAYAQQQIAKSRFYPDLYVEAQQNWDDETAGRLGRQDEFNVMLRVSWDLFNGFADQAAVKRLAYQLSVAKDIRDDSLRQLDEGTRLAWNAWKFTNRQLGFLQGHVEAANQTVTAYIKQFDIGKRTLLDVLNTENELFEAKLAYLDAEYAEMEAKYRLLNATGVLLDALRITVPAEWQESRR
ncbi:MAG: TolC family outer membrane protein [Ferrimonas sp.]